MTKYWAIDWIGEYECEPIVGEQLYRTEEEAEQARLAREDADQCEVNWYTEADIEDFFNLDFTIDDNLKVQFSF